MQRHHRENEGQKNLPSTQNNPTAKEMIKEIIPLMIKTLVKMNSTTHVTNMSIHLPTMDV